MAAVSEKKPNAKSLGRRRAPLANPRSAAMDAVRAGPARARVGEAHVGAGT